MDVKTVWTAMVGQDDIPVLVGSVLVYGLAFLICLVLQHFLRLVLPRSLYSYAADFCLTMAICAYPYSHGSVRQLYGHTGYIIAAVTAVTVTCLFFEGTPSPLGVFQRYLKGMETWWGLIVRAGIQVLAALLSYRLVYFIWSLEVTKEHQHLKYSGCESDLRVPVLIGCLLEFSSVLYDTWLSHQQLFRNSLLDTVIKNINGALLVCAGFQMTGMYMHPAMATGMSWNCKGTSTLEHVSVYWLASFMGCFAGERLNSLFQLPFSTPAAPVRQEKSRKDADGWNRKYKGETRNDNIVKRRKQVSNNNNIK